MKSPSERGRLIRLWFAALRRFLVCKDRRRGDQLFALAMRLTDRLNRLHAANPTQQRLWWLER